MQILQAQETAVAVPAEDRLRALEAWTEGDPQDGALRRTGTRIAGRATRTRVTVETPTALADPAGDPVETFERLWSRLPAFRGNNSFCFLDDDGGVFLKGQRLRLRASLTALHQAGRLVREVRNLGAIRAAGLPVPEIVLHGVERRLGVTTRALVVLRRVRSSCSLQHALRTSQEHERADVWEPLGRLVAEMHSRDFFHRDLTARNVLIQRRGGDARIYLIDCPRGALSPPAARRPFMRRADLFRLGRSIRDAGGTEQEVRLLLRACEFGAADDLLTMIGRSRSAGGARPLRTKIWVAFGV